ncbi:PucR family transcriptional regulator [Niallia oryzisoli]|uniref:PucR family transcriptional regulator n=1 Tax=Niallia oryzisoli TaxID=1737571 RepID=A0ABZ2C8V0_9BACI
MRITELLSVPLLKEMRLIAGESGKEREVHTINMMDAPDIIPFLNPNEFLVTTAYHIKDQPHRLIELIKAMSDQGCAALGIKTKRYLEAVPQEALDLANELSLPIIELPLELSLGEIVNYTLRAILDSRAAELSSAIESHKQFTNIIMQGKGIQVLLQELTKLIHRKVNLVDQHLIPLLQPYTKLEISIIKSDLEKEIKGFPLSNNTNITFSMIASKETYTLFPVNMSEKKIGFLLVVGAIPQEDHLTILTIEQAINVLSFTLMKEHALKQHARNIRNDFFLHFLDGAFSVHDEIINRAKEFSLQNERDYICVVGKMDNDENSYYTYTQRQQKADNLFEYMEDLIHPTISNVHVFTKSENCILLFEVHDQNVTPHQGHDHILRYIQEKIAVAFGHTVSFGVSNICHSFIQLRTAYQEAFEALSQGELAKKTGFIHTFRTKDIIELLRLIPEKEINSFYQYTFKGFSSIKQDEKESLLQTLSVYLETHCQISETAKRLFVHRNTVVYRIDKCEEILSKSLKDPETTLQLRIAFRMKKLLDSSFLHSLTKT